LIREDLAMTDDPTLKASSRRVESTPPRRPTISDVAARAGVSKGAVSFAVNGNRGVSEATRERVVRAAQELGWQPNRMAKSLSQSRAEGVGMVLNRPMRTLGVEPFFAQLSSGISAELAGAGLSLHTFIAGSAEEELQVYRHWWLEQRVDGMILMDPREDDPRIEYLIELGLPTVVIGEVGARTDVSNVWVDDQEAMRTVVDHLIQLGHRRIAHVCGTTEFLHTARRVAVLAAAAEDGRLDWARSLPTDFSDTEGARTTRELLAGDGDATAVIYDSDVMALVGVGVMLEHGLELPRDMSVVSFDDSLLTRQTHPSITALTRDTFEYGAIVARALIDVLGHPGQQVSLQAPTPLLTVRQTSGPPRAARR
jgi:Transcriptional regulators